MGSLSPIDASLHFKSLISPEKISLEDLQKADVCAYFNVYGYALVAEEKWQEARDVYNTYLQYAREKEDKSQIHKAYHQLAMVERLSGRYSEALEYIKLEKAVIDKAFADDPLIRSVNRYEYAYLMYLKGEICVSQSVPVTSVSPAAGSAASPSRTSGVPTESCSSTTSPARRAS